MASEAACGLRGKRVVITRAAQQSQEICEALEAKGAVAIVFPVIAIAPPEDFSGLDAELRGISDYDWILFTSQNGVAATAERLKSLSLVSSDRFPKIAVVGPATARVCEDFGWKASYVAQQNTGTDLGRELRGELSGKKVLLPRGDRANPLLVKELKGYGAKVTEVIAYRTVFTRPDVVPDAESFVRDLDAVLFFSPSAVHSFAEIFGHEFLRRVPVTKAVGAIGPVTARALRHAGVERIVESPDTTVSAIVDALAYFFERLAESSNVETSER